MLGELQDRSRGQKLEHILRFRDGLPQAKLSIEVDINVKIEFDLSLKSK